MSYQKPHAWIGDRDNARSAFAVILPELQYRPLYLNVPYLRRTRRSVTYSFFSLAGQASRCQAFFCVLARAEKRNGPRDFPLETVLSPGSFSALADQPLSFLAALAASLDAAIDHVRHPVSSSFLRSAERLPTGRGGSLAVGIPARADDVLPPPIDACTGYRLAVRQ